MATRPTSSHALVRAALLSACAWLVCSCVSPTHTVQEPDGPSPDPHSTARTATSAAHTGSQPAQTPRWRDHGEVVDARELDAEVVAIDATPTHRFVRADAPLFVEITLDALQVGPVVERPPLNLSIVIDRSGSMKGDKIVSVRKAASWLVEHLDDGDHVTVVSYAGRVQVDASARLDETSRQTVLDAIAAIPANGGTNLGGGLTAGGDAALAFLDTVSDDTPLQSRVVLLSDGIANQGMTSPAELAQLADRYRESTVTVSTMGVGLDYNEDLMELVATTGGGNYHYIREAADIGATFDGELASLNKTSAADSRIEIGLSDGVELREVYGYRFEQDGNLVRIQTDDLVVGRTRRLLLALDLPAHASGELEVASVQAEFTDALSGRRARLQLEPLMVTVTDDQARIDASASPRVIEKRERVLGALARREAHAAVEAGDRNRAVEVIRTRQAELATVDRALDSDVLREEAAALEALAVQFEALPEAPEALRRVKKSKTFRDAVKRDKSESKGLIIY